MVVLGALALNMMAIRIYTFGVFLIPLTTQFNWGRGEFSGASAVGAPISAVAAIISGRLSDKYGPRPLVTAFGVVMAISYILLSQVDSLWQVYLVMGLLMPIAMSGCLVPVMSTISRWFSKKRATALGITMTGFALGTVIWPPIAQLLISSYGWQEAFVVLALIIAVVSIPIAQFMKHSPQRVRLLPYGVSTTMEGDEELSLVDEGLSLREAMKTKHFWLWGPILFCFFFCLDLIVTHIVAYALDAGIPAIVAAATLSIIGGISIIGRLSGGLISDRIGLKKMASGSLSLIMVALAVLLSDQEGWSFYAFTLIFGLGYGLFIILESAMPAGLFGTKSLGTIMATLGLFAMIGSAAGRTLAGTIFDMTGSYKIAFLLCTVLAVMAIIISMLLLRSRIPTAQSSIKNTTGQH
jgi:OFA family oxalate/formate antiporter-like MFS transporter